jgi:DNA polymerase elongation subunit (family B)
MERSNAILELMLAAPNEEAAKEICRNWKKKYQNIYGAIMEELL